MSNSEEKKGWLARLKQGLGRSSAKLTGGISALFTHRKLDDDALEELEELLITSDLGVSVSTRLVKKLAEKRYDQEISGDEIRTILATEISLIMEPVAKPFTVDATLKPHVILFCGVNGSGKTTTIGKLAKQFKDEGHSVLLAAGDTFRAAAVEQLQAWGDRTGCEVITAPTGSDSASLAYEALEKAQASSTDILMIDTAGRLQNKSALMDELIKVIRVIKKLDPEAPHDCLLVLDATVGQNAHSQVEVFKEMVNVSGLVMTKLDGTAKGGVAVSLAETFELPIHALGVGEGIADLRPFQATPFAHSLLGLET